MLHQLKSQNSIHDFELLSLVLLQMPEIFMVMLIMQTKVIIIDDNSSDIIAVVLSFTDHLDKALLRPGRLGVHLEVGLPNAEQCYKILLAITKVRHAN